MFKLDDIFKDRKGFSPKEFRIKELQSSLLDPDQIKR